VSPPNTIRISRDGAEIGAWTLAEINQFLASGSLQSTDHYFDESIGNWQPIVPPFHRKCLDYDWADGCEAWYYVHDGQIVGPRSTIEINALIAAGHLKPDSWLANIGAERWFTVSEKNEVEEGGRAASDHAKEAVNKFLSGDKAGAVMSGWKSLRRFWEDAEANAAEVTRHLATRTDKANYPGDEYILQQLRAAGFSVDAYQRFARASGEVLVIQFPNKDEALAAQAVMDGTEITPSFRLELGFTELGIG
jgi:hypothetical protein